MAIEYGKAIKGFVYIFGKCAVHYSCFLAAWKVAAHRNHQQPCQEIKKLGMSHTITAKKKKKRFLPKVNIP